MAKRKSRAKKQNPVVGCLVLIVGGVIAISALSNSDNDTPRRSNPINFSAPAITEELATPRPTSTMPVFTPEFGAAMTMESPQTVYVSEGGANLRSEPKTDSELVDTLQSGDPLLVNGYINGDAVDFGNAIWYTTRWQGDIAYIYSGLVQFSPPEAPAAQVEQVAPTNVPVPIIQPPSQSVSPAPVTGVTCPSMSYTCGSGLLTCEQAYACLAAGNSQLDSDDDGIPCEAICQ